MSTEEPEKAAALRRLPAVHELLNNPRIQDGMRGAGIPRWALKRAARTVLDRRRDRIRTGDGEDPAADIPDEVLAEACGLALPTLRPVVNATGVLLHTNLGRAPLASEALAAITAAARGYSNLELNLDTGKRGLRYHHVEGILCELTGAEAALVVNNNASAVYLALCVLARGKEVIVSRGELVEIGGSFRIPDILRESGATLIEVGTTNRVRLADYERAVGSSTGLLLKVHPSNYRVVGFHGAVGAEELVGLGRRRGLPVMEDLGSGCLADPGVLGFRDEPSVRQALGTGVDLVTFSGDKLLGGPQAGILLGRGEILKAVQSHPLNRVLRIDKLTLAALEATLRLYREPAQALRQVPALAMLTTPAETLRRRARRLAVRLRRLLPEGFAVSVRRTVARAGGGSVPLEEIPGVAVAVTCDRWSAQEMLVRLRQASVPVIARLERDVVILETRTLQRGEERLVSRAFEEAFVRPDRPDRP